MYKQCKTEQSAKRQRELEQGLLEAMFQQHYDEISVSDLCDKMQVPRKSFYRYFSSKDGALHALIDHVLMDYDLYLSPEFSETCTPLQYMEQIFAYWYDRKDVLDALERSKLSGLLIQRAITRAQEETNRPLHFWPNEIQLEQKHVTMFMVCGLMSMVVQWHHDGYPESTRQMAKIALRLLTEPLVSGLEQSL